MAVFAGSLGMRLVNIGGVLLWLEDDVMHVPNASFYSRWGGLAPDNWYTPPLKHLLLYAHMLVFGDDPVGWRMRGVLLGAGVVVLTFLLAWRFFSAKAAVVASVLLALDPLSVAFSRSTFEDVPASFFVVLGVFGALEAMRSGRTRHLVLAGSAFGIAVALRWHAVFALMVVLVLALVPKSRGKAEPVGAASYLIGLPIAVYALTFLPWVSRGYSLGEWALMQWDAIGLQARLTLETFDFPGISSLAGPHKWLVVPMGAGFEVALERGRAAYSVVTSDPWVWIWFIPAIALLVWEGVRRRETASLAVGATFAATYAFFLVSSRPILLYSLLVILPLGFVGLGYACARLPGRWGWWSFGAATAVSLLLYPAASMFPMPIAYRAVLMGVRLVAP